MVKKIIYFSFVLSFFPLFAMDPPDEPPPFEAPSPPQKRREEEKIREKKGKEREGAKPRRRRQRGRRAPQEREGYKRLGGLPEFMKPGWVLLEEKLPISQFTIKDVIEEQQKKEKSFILARVLTIDDDKYHMHFFDGSALNNWLFKKLYGDEVATWKNPLNNLPIRSIDYFIIDSLQDPAFQFFGTDYGLIDDPKRKDKMRVLFDAHYGKLNEETVNAWLTLAKNYRQGINGFEQNNEKAKQFMILIARDGIEFLAVPHKIEALIYLIALYKQGQKINLHEVNTKLEEILGQQDVPNKMKERAGIALKELNAISSVNRLIQTAHSFASEEEYNFSDAKKFFELAIMQDTDPNVKEFASIGLASLYMMLDRKLTGPELTKIEELYKNVIRNNIHPENKVEASFGLGELLIKKGKPEEAKEYFKAISLQDEYPELQRNALHRLKEIEEEKSIESEEGKGKEREQ